VKRGERAACVHLLGLQLTGRILSSQRAIYGLILQAQQNIVRLHPGDMGASLARVREGRTTAGLGAYEHAMCVLDATTNWLSDKTPACLR
jgi:hypothetical protein